MIDLFFPLKVCPIQQLILNKLGPPHHPAHNLLPDPPIHLLNCQKVPFGPYHNTVTINIVQVLFPLCQNVLPPFPIEVVLVDWIVDGANDELFELFVFVDVLPVEVVYLGLLLLLDSSFYLSWGLCLCCRFALY